MQFKAAALQQISQFICGDPALPFPYRSSSRLTAFFTGLGLDYVHHGETRNIWTREALIGVNSNSPVGGVLPGDGMKSVIEELMNPTYFELDSSGKVDFDQALAQLNRVLKPYKLEVLFDHANEMSQLISSDGIFVSTAHKPAEAAEKITFAPKVFSVPSQTEVQRDLVAIMMPFEAAFTSVHVAINKACNAVGFRSKRADDIWKNSTVIQDIVDLIIVAQIVIVDFTGKNPNVMYETGIAHTLGKHVVPITQSIEHVPFDLQSHRVLKYLPNQQGLEALAESLTKRLSTLRDGYSWE